MFTGCRSRLRLYTYHSLGVFTLTVGCATGCKAPPCAKLYACRPLGDLHVGNGLRRQVQSFVPDGIKRPSGAQLYTCCPLGDLHVNNRLWRQV